MPKLCHCGGKQRGGPTLDLRVALREIQVPPKKTKKVLLSEVPEVVDVPWNYKDKVPIFSLKSKATFVPEDKAKNTAYLATPGQNFDLTENTAPIFATFGYRDPRFYVPLEVCGGSILALLDSGQPERMWVPRQLDY